MNIQDQYKPDDSYKKSKEVRNQSDNTRIPIVKDFNMDKMQNKNIIYKHKRNHNDATKINDDLASIHH